MTLTLFKYSGETNRLDKAPFLTGGVDRSGEIKGTFNIDSPQFVFTYPGELTGYNYLAATFDGTTHYYYARITGDVGGRLIATCTRDALMTFKTGIAALPVKSARCEQRADDVGVVRGFNSFLPDPNRQVLQSTLQRRFVLGSMTWQPTRILVTVG